MDKMTFSEFLKFVATIKMLYGATIATKFFEQNISEFYNLSYDEFKNNLLSKTQ